MRHISLVICLLLFIQANVISQSCLPEGIVFTTQAQIDSFQINYPGCTEIEGDVTIAGDGITNLNGLNVLKSVDGDVWIVGQSALTKLSGLDSVSSIGGCLLINYNPTLKGIFGLGNVNSIGENLQIEDNAALTSLSGLDNLTSIGGYLQIANNDTLTSLSGLENVDSIDGYLSIEYNKALVSLSGLDNMTFLGGDLVIEGNETLISLSSLENITSIGGYLLIYANRALTSLSSLGNVTSIGGFLSVDYNASLSSLSGLDNVTSIGGYIWINHNPILTSLTGLNKVAYAEGLWIEGNDALTSLSGLDNINAESISGLYIDDNTALSTCEVHSVCDILTGQNVSVEIHDNAPGCNSQEEVEDACMVSVENVNREYDISIFPNPANNQLTISSKVGTIEEVIIYNQTGQMVLNQIPGNNTIDISHLHPGVYFVEVVIGQSRIREKLIIK